MTSKEKKEGNTEFAAYSESLNLSGSLSSVNNNDTYNSNDDKEAESKERYNAEVNVNEPISVSHITLSLTGSSSPVASQRNAQNSAQASSPFSGTLRNVPQWQGPVVPQGETMWRAKENDRLSELQLKYEKLLGDKAVPFYENLKQGEMFRALCDINYRVFKGDLNKTEDRHGSTYVVTHVTRNPDWIWEKVNKDDTLMYVSKDKDEDGEITPRWIITSVETGDARIRDLYIASYKLNKLFVDE